jgi:ATP-dependent RNA helicase DDX47/RRP3
MDWRPVLRERDIIMISSLDLPPSLAAALLKAGFQAMTETQEQAVPPSLRGESILCMAATGTGKTLCYIIPVLARLAADPDCPPSAVLVPTRELAHQVLEMFRAVAAFLEGVELRWALLVGETDPMQQVIQLARKPQLVVGTPGRFCEHVKNTKGFSLPKMSCLVLDEVDRLVSYENIRLFEEIVRALPKRQTLMYSATVNKHVTRLQKLISKDTRFLELQNNYSVPSGLRQVEHSVKARLRDSLLLYILTHRQQASKVIVFASCCESAMRLARMLRHLQFGASELHGRQTQEERTESMEAFRGEQGLLVCTDVASRGLDVHGVGLVVNYDVPEPMAYVHRVGRTARMGAQGLAVTFVTEYSIEAMLELRARVQDIARVAIDEREVSKFLERATLANQAVKLPRKLSSGSES